MNTQKGTLASVAAAVLLSASLHNAFAQSCGAAERWFVKMGTDPDAGLVDLAHIVPNTVQGMNQLPLLQPTVPPHDDKARLEAERVVYQVHARLKMFKAESDADYHLVITDDSQNYSPGGSGTDGQETGTSFIAEIPNPDCVAGAHGDPNMPSLFATQLRAVRQKFEARFPGGAQHDTDLHGIPVTLTGVAFYDRPHRQTGRAVNGIELHPLLDITFDDGPAPTSGGTTTGGATTTTTTTSTTTTTTSTTKTELIADGDFEGDASSWSGTANDIGSYQGEHAHAGSNFAWMGGTGKAHSESLYQDLTITGQNATLSLWLNLFTDEITTTKTYDKLYVQIRDQNDAVLKTLATYTNLTPTSGWKKRTFDVSAYSGQAVRLYFRMVEDHGKPTSFELDDVSLTTH